MSRNCFSVYQRHEDSIRRVRAELLADAPERAIENRDRVARERVFRSSVEHHREPRVVALDQRFMNRRFLPPFVQTPLQRLGTGRVDQGLLVEADGGVGVALPAIHLPEERGGAGDLRVERQRALETVGGVAIPA